jgi:hypothetical protein
MTIDQTAEKEIFTLNKDLTTASCIIQTIEDESTERS